MKTRFLFSFFLLTVQAAWAQDMQKQWLLIENCYTSEPVQGARIKLKYKNSLQEPYQLWQEGLSDSLGMAALDVFDFPFFRLEIEAQDYYKQSLSRAPKSPTLRISLRPSNVVEVVGQVKSPDGQALPPGTRIVVSSETENMQLEVQADGSFRFYAKPETQYLAKLEAEGFLSATDSFLTQKTAQLEGAQALNTQVETNLALRLAIDARPDSNAIKAALVAARQQDFFARLYKKDEAIELPNLRFQNKEEQLQSASVSALDSLIQLLQEKPNLRVELSIHTDAKRSHRYNQLAAERQLAVLQRRLQKAGIPPTQCRLIARGEEEPLPNTNPEDAANNRIDIQVLEDELE